MRNEYQSVSEFTNGSDEKLNAIHKLATCSHKPKIDLFCCRKFSSPDWHKFYKNNNDLYRYFPIAKGIIHPTFSNAKEQEISSVYFDYYTFGNDLEKADETIEWTSQKKKEVGLELINKGVFGAVCYFRLHDLYFHKNDLDLILSEFQKKDHEKKIPYQNIAAENKIKRLEALLAATLELANEEKGEPLSHNEISEKAQKLFDQKNQDIDLSKGFSTSSFRNDLKNLTKIEGLKIPSNELNRAIEKDFPKVRKKYSQS